MRQNEFTQILQELTPKPSTVLKLLVEGKTDEEVATIISASPATVRKHIQNLCDRFNIAQKVEGYKRNRREDLIALASSYLLDPIAEQTRSPTKTRQDWGEAIDVGAFCGREAELAELEDWIVNDRCRLVAILGMGGIGKTALSLKLAERISGEFQVVIWRSLRHAPSIQDLLANLIQSLSNGQETVLPQTLEERISCLVKYLRASRCLLILDNAESILQKGDFAGNYRDGYEGYSDLLERIGLGSMGEEPHRSCLILTSREKPKDITELEGTNLPIRSLQLTGLKNEEAKEILSAKNLSGSEGDYQKLVNRYIGNPLALKIVSTTIQELFGGDIANFLVQSTIVFGGIRNLLKGQFERLSGLEEKVMYWLAINRDWVSLSELWGDIVPPIPQMELLEALESLVRRSLIETSSASFSLQDVVMEYVTDRLVERACEEIATREIAFLKSHALIKAQANDYFREMETRYILEPLLKRLITMMGNEREIEAQLIQILSTIRGKSPLETGYVGGMS